MGTCQSKNARLLILLAASWAGRKNQRRSQTAATVRRMKAISVFMVDSGLLGLGDRVCALDLPKIRNESIKKDDAGKIISFSKYWITGNGNAGLTPWSAAGLGFLCRCSCPFPRNPHFPARPIPFN